MSDSCNRTSFGKEKFMLKRIAMITRRYPLIFVLTLALHAISAQAQPFAYVTNASSNNVSVIDTASNTVVATVGVGCCPRGVAFTPDGTRAYVANNDGTVSVIATAINTVVATVVVENGSWGVAITPDGTRAYIANFNSNSVSVIDTASN